MPASAAQTSAELTIRADTWDARRASVWLEFVALAGRVPPEQVVRLDHCLDEALANVIKHGGPAALASPVQLQFGVRRSAGACTAELSVADAGVAFDPATYEPKPAPKPARLAEAKPGGLGLLMIRSFSDKSQLPPQRRPQPSHDHGELDRGGMTAATLDGLREIRNEHGAGIDAIALFRGVDPSAVIDAISDCEIRTLSPGAMLLRAGEMNDTIYVVMSGQVAAYLDSALLPDAGIPIVSGESVGEMSAIDGKPASAFVVALTEARVLSLPGRLFWGRLAPVPGVMRNLLAALSERMRRGNEVMLKAQRTQLALEQMARELQIARQLQASMIPLRGRLFRERSDIEIAGVMNPASEVGGDFFDAFFVDDRHLFLCVGDVSGHGIPAALFMARTIGLIRIAAMGTRNPGRLLEGLNEQLCAGNSANIFVTLFCAFLDVTSGRLVYANAGHCAPFLAHAGRASSIPIPKGALVGVFPARRYSAGEVELQGGVALVCFTDGVSEAESAEGREFSEAHLGSVVAANADRSVEELLDAVQRELADFVDDAPPADDCTLLVVRRPARP